MSRKKIAFYWKVYKLLGADETTGYILSILIMLYEKMKRQIMPSTRDGQSIVRLVLIHKKFDSYFHLHKMSTYLVVVSVTLILSKHLLCS